MTTVNTDINPKSPVSIVKGLAIAAVLLAGTMLLIKATAWAADKLKPGAGELVKKPFRI